MDPDIISEELRNRYKTLALEDTDDTTVTIPANITPRQEFVFVGVLFYDRDFGDQDQHFFRTVSNLWQPRFGVNFKRINGAHHRFLITFYHVRDYERVWKGSPWSFNNKLLALALLKQNEDPDTVEVKSVPIWIQVFGVPIGYVSSHVCEAIGTFSGELIEVDENNFKVSRPAYLRVKVLIDISKPIKRRMRLCINERNHVMVHFQYERLPSMCLICGMFQHTESNCPLTYLSKDPPKRMYEPSIRATVRKFMITEADRWLRDENGCSLIPTGSYKNAERMEEAQQKLAKLGHDIISSMDEDQNVVIETSDAKRKRYGVVEVRQNSETGHGEIPGKPASSLERARSSS